MTTSDPHGRHDWHSPQYVEDWISSAETRDAERRIILRRLVSLISQPADAAIRVLDVGAGYGALSAQILDRFPQAQLVCQDFSEPMFAQARQRLAWASERVSFTQSDLSDPRWTHALTGPFDAVVSAIAIHNVRYPERIRAIYSEIFDVLAPGGCFLNYDLIFVRGPAAAAAYDSARSLEDWVQGGDGEASRPHTVATERSADERETITLEQQLCWLREGGFQDVECFWKEMRNVIIGGFRSATA
jgi:tRNA (cmo5U34)-methyltransferase